MVVVQMETPQAHPTNTACPQQHIHEMPVSAPWYTTGVDVLLGCHLLRMLPMPRVVHGALHQPGRHIVTADDE